MSYIYAPQLLRNQNNNSSSLMLLTLDAHYIANVGHMNPNYASNTIQPNLT